MSTSLERQRNRRKRRRVISESEEEEDEDWKPGLDDFVLDEPGSIDIDDTLDLIGLKATDPETYRALEEVKQEIAKTEPDIFSILKEPMMLHDRAELFQLYELYKSMEFSEEQIALKKKIYTKYNQAIAKYRQHNEYSRKERKQFETEISHLETFDEWKEMKYTILSLNTIRDNKQVIYGAYKRLSSLSETDEEHHKLRHWLKWAVSLPYDNLKTFPYTKNKITTFLQQVSERLDRELYGMHSVKEQILVFLNARMQNPKIKKCTLGLVGPPGVGKTYISRLLADVIEFPFEQISFGGVSDATFLKGHSSTYIGAEPGELVRRLSKMKYKNGIMFFDEFNRISKELCAALLHIIDPTQNTDTFDERSSRGCSVKGSYLSDRSTGIQQSRQALSLAGLSTP
jgi:ATP-dependent Lon protease